MTDTVIAFHMKEITNKFTPPFSYSYMCSSSVLTRFIPVFVIGNILLGFIAPVIMSVIIYASSEFETVRELCVLFMPPLLFPSEAASAKPLFSPHVIMSKLFHQIALLLTFGVACPPLAVAILVTVCIITIGWQVMVGRYICHTKKLTGMMKSQSTEKSDEERLGCGTDIDELTDQGKKNPSCGEICNDDSSIDLPHAYNQFMIRLNSHCDGVERCPQSCLWVVVYSTASFFSVIIFDISGDHNGWLITLLFFNLPIIFFLASLRLVSARNFFGFVRVYDNRPAENGVELTIRTTQESPLHNSHSK